MAGSRGVPHQKYLVGVSTEFGAFGFDPLDDGGDIFRARRPSTYRCQTVIGDDANDPVTREVCPNVSRLRFVAADESTAMQENNDGRQLG